LVLSSVIYIPQWIHPKLRDVCVRMRVCVCFHGAS
jgi:hypothetical protein